SAVAPEGMDFEARADRPYRRERVVADKRALVRAYGNAGFVRAEADNETVARDSLARVDVTYEVKRGAPVVFDTLLVNVRRAAADDSLGGLTREDLLRSLVPYHRGDTIRVDDNDKVIEKLQSTGLYNTVRIEDTLLPGGKGSVLTLDVEEKVPGRLHASVFYETQYGFGVAGDVSHSNVAGTLKEARIGSGLAQDKQYGTVGFGSPLLFGYLLRFDNDFTVEWFQDKLPDESPFHGDLRVANTANVSRNFTAWLRGVAGAELEYKNRIVADSVGDLSREKGGLLNVTTTGFASFLDQPLNPTRGVRFALTVGNGGPILQDGDLNVVQKRHNWVEARSATYTYPSWLPQAKFAFRLDGGRFFGAGGQNADRFFLGGPRSVRSYGFRQVCADVPPPDEGSCPLDQDALEPAYFLVSAEARLSPFAFASVPSRGFAGFFRPLDVVPFVDYGKVWNLRSENFSFSRDFLESGYGKAVAYGGGIRYPLLGIFSMRLDLAWGRPGNGSWPDQWVIDLAQAF
ncbi:MAG TPA: BamA/TamA family outer membrane protein, partial [Fibrobacteria bacterium]|nr:BamA/TamA family outer membrane protein [Fibrobacteria bacterium]